MQKPFDPTARPLLISLKKIWQNFQYWFHCKKTFEKKINFFHEKWTIHGPSFPPTPVEPIFGNGSANRSFLAKLYSFVFYSFFIDLSSENHKLADIVSLPGSSANVARLKRIFWLFPIWKNSKSTTPLISFWVIFVYFLAI